MKWLVVAVLIGCGGGGSARPVPTPEDFDDAYKDAACRYAARCGLWSSVDACLASNAFPQTLLRAGASASVEAGRARWNEENATACVAAFTTRTCDSTTEASRHVPAACFSLTTGTRPNLGGCSASADCISTVCQIASCDPSGCCAGACAGGAEPRVAALGEPCDPSIGCEAGAWCPPSSGGQLFTELTCSRLQLEGEACFGDSSICAYGLACTTQGVCGAPKESGATCEAGDGCRAVDERCISGTCRRAPVDGEACTDLCQAPFFCDAGVCASGAPTGGVCDSVHPCADASDVCLSSTQTCGAPRADGGDCFLDRECAGGHCTIDGRCGAAPSCVVPR